LTSLGGLLVKFLRSWWGKLVCQSADGGATTMRGAVITLASERLSALTSMTGGVEVVSEIEVPPGGRVREETDNCWTWN
jgi:hypothetical protein